MERWAEHRRPRWEERSPGPARRHARAHPQAHIPAFHMVRPNVSLRAATSAEERRTTAAAMRTALPAITRYEPLVGLVRAGAGFERGVPVERE